MRPLADYTCALLKTRLTPYLCCKVKEEEVAAPVGGGIDRPSDGPFVLGIHWAK